MKKNKADLIIDIGKSNIKFIYFNKKNGEILKKNVFINNFLKKKNNFIELDHKKILNLIYNNIEFNRKIFELKSILPITHGSIFFLLDKNKKVLNCISDESDLGKKFNLKYEKFVNKIQDTYTPYLEYCHNLSKSLFYIKEKKRNVFKKIKYLLLYPNFISFKLSNKYSTDLPYLSNHSFLWDFKKKKLNSFAKYLKLDKNLPGINNENIHNKLGPLYLKNYYSKDTTIYSGKHDSSCCFYYHRKKFKKKFILISTGTWIIIYNENKKINKNKIKMDTHLSQSIQNKIISVARYPGGHEFKYLNKKIKKKPNLNFKIIKKIFENKDMIIPGFYNGGAFKNRIGNIFIKEKKNKNSQIYNYHLNLLYIACMTYFSLNLLGKETKPIVVDGIFIKNKLFTKFISCLSNKKVYISNDENGVARGGYLIINKIKKLKNNYKEVKKDNFLKKLIIDYYKFWKSKVVN